jgi:hypothetical protein
VDLQQPESTDPASQATITTGESAFNDGSRRMITGVRPLLTGADGAVSVLYRDELNPTGVTNYVLYSEQMDNAAWTKQALNVTANDATAPDGSATADLITGDGTGSQAIITQDTQALTTGLVCYSVYLKYSNEDGRYIRILGDTSATDTIVCDTSNGLITFTGSGVVASGTETVSNDFFRFWFVHTTGDTTPQFRMAQSDSGGTLKLGSDTGQTYIWGAQAEDAESLGAYSETVASITTLTYSETLESTISSRSGIAPFRAESRYHKVKLRVSGGFTTILGCDVEFEQSGEI